MATTLTPAKLSALMDNLYDEVRQHGSETRLYTQKDLLDLGLIPNNDVTLLLRVVQGLCDDRLLVGTQDNRSGLAWRWRGEEDAKKYKALPSSETAMVYQLVDESGADGIWSRTLKARLKMHESVLKQCLKELERRNYISDMKSVEHPNKKMYIRADLRPSDRATGGPWYTDSDLDEAFITELEMIVFDYVKGSSVRVISTQSGAAIAGGGGGGGGGPSAQRRPVKGTIRGGGCNTADSTAQPRGTKRGSDYMTDGPEASSRAVAPSAPKARGRKHCVPYPAGYMHYPTVREIAKYIDASNLTRNTTLSEDDIQQLVDVLLHDGLLEPVEVGRRKGYRVTRAARQNPELTMKKVVRERERGGDEDLIDRSLGPEPGYNGLVDVPCGRCPVFDICEPGGPVSPNNCVYFQKWLDLQVWPCTK